ncbi:ROK family protein [Nibricoccus sp. IMCC34717]|uniref:ROK family protein n=1 Tax=Nibricoccus sp. IMCC34717 TaxID=3034021 RepID=UPI00384CE33A
MKTEAQALTRTAFGVDVGGTRTKAGLVCLESGRVLAQRVFPTPKDSRDGFVARLRVVCEELAEEAHCPPAVVSHLGIGLPGFVEGAAVSQLWEDLRFLEGERTGEELGKALGRRCVLDNDARVVALGEARWGAGKGCSRFLSLTLGTGLGFGFVVDGAFQEPTSRNHLAGHLKIRADGPACFCGLTGCLEALVSAEGLMHWTRRRGVAQASPEAVVAAAGAELEAEAALHDWVEALADGLNSYVHVFAPDRICLGGGVARALDAGRLLELQRRLVAKPWPGYRCEIVRDCLGEQAGVLGAAAL